MPETTTKLPSIPCTNAYMEYIEHEVALAGFRAFLSKLIVAVDGEKVKKAVDMIVRSQTEFVSLYDFVQTDLNSVGTEMQTFRNCFLQMILCNSVDSYLVYLTELLALIFETRPEMLKSKQSITVEFVVEHLETNDVIPALVEQRVMELSYKGISDLCAYRESKLGFPLFPDQDKMHQAVRFVDIRNTIVHNRGKVSGHLVQRHPEFKNHLGKVLVLTEEEVPGITNFLLDSAEDIDKRAICAFSITTAVRPSSISQRSTAQ